MLNFLSHYKSLKEGDYNRVNKPQYLLICVLYFITKHEYKFAKFILFLKMNQVSSTIYKVLGLRFFLIIIYFL